MAVLSKDEVNLKTILERFKKIGSGYQEIKLGSPDIGRDLTFEEELKIHPEDWKKISQEISQKYKGNVSDLILVWAIPPTSWKRISRCTYDVYSRK